MRAFICDACGEVYKPYFALNGYGEGNMMTIVKSEKDGKLKCKMRFELCPSCMQKVHDFVANNLVVEGSPADKRYFAEEETPTPADASTGSEAPV